MPTDLPDPPLRPVTCSRCGTGFGCGIEGDCWCAAEALRLPVPAAGDGDCLCRSCLREAAAAPVPEPG